MTPDDMTDDEIADRVDAVLAASRSLYWALPKYLASFDYPTDVEWQGVAESYHELGEALRAIDGGGSGVEIRFVEGDPG